MNKFYRPIPKVPDCAVEMRSLAHHGRDISFGPNLKVGNAAAVTDLVSNVLIHT